MSKPSILVLCTGNSCRSQMAEAFLRARLGDHAEVFSAGSKPSGYVHPLALEAMREVGYDLTGSTSKALELFLGREIATVITVCGNANDVCPVFPGQRNRHHWAFDDPAHATGSEEERMAVFRRVRDQIRAVFEAYAAGLVEGLEVGGDSDVRIGGVQSAVRRSGRL